MVARLALLGRGSSPCSVPASFQLPTLSPSHPIGDTVVPRERGVGVGHPGPLSQEPSCSTLLPQAPERGLGRDVGLGTQGLQVLQPSSWTMCGVWTWEEDSLGAVNPKAEGLRGHTCQGVLPTWPLPPRAPGSTHPPTLVSASKAGQLFQGGLGGPGQRGGRVVEWPWGAGKERPTSRPWSRKYKRGQSGTEGSEPALCRHLGPGEGTPGYP